MESYDRYRKLRDRCLRYWNLHPDSSGSVADLWNKTGQVIAETSAAALFGDAADLIDVQRREIEACRSIIKQLMPKLPIEGLSVDNVIEGELHTRRDISGSSE